MLNASRSEVTYLKEILPATYGIIFLGTPHRGSAVATLGKIAQEITKILWKSPNITVLRDLEVNSQTLERVGRGFSQILVEKEVKIHSFREERKTKGIMVGFWVRFWLSELICLIQIVDPFSSAIEHGMEIVGSIPADHEHMTKFAGPLDAGFIRIAATLSRWVEDIRSECQKEVDSPDDNARINEVSIQQNRFLSQNWTK
jgi:hypothetical protein